MSHRWDGLVDVQVTQQDHVVFTVAAALHRGEYVIECVQFRVGLVGVAVDRCGWHEAPAG